MITAIIWLYLFLNEYIKNPDVFWTLYIPVQAVEVIIFIKLLPKFADWLDKIIERKMKK